MAMANVAGQLIVHLGTAMHASLCSHQIESSCTSLPGADNHLALLSVHA